MNFDYVLRWSRSILYGTKIILYIYTHKAHPKRWKKCPFVNFAQCSCLYLKFNIIPCFLCSLAWGSLFGKKYKFLSYLNQEVHYSTTYTSLLTRVKGVSTQLKTTGPTCHHPEIEWPITSFYPKILSSDPTHLI